MPRPPDSCDEAPGRAWASVLAVLQLLVMFDPVAWVLGASSSARNLLLLLRFPASPAPRRPSCGDLFFNGDQVDNEGAQRRGTSQLRGQ